MPNFNMNELVTTDFFTSQNEVVFMELFNQCVEAYIDLQYWAMTDYNDTK